MKNSIIAMWSGPRNLSTALMRSFASRSDCQAMDEPYYAAYLKASGAQHPMGDEIIADGETDPQKVASQCLAPPTPPHKIVYQKHMTHHMLKGFDLQWMQQVTNIFLLRDPRRVLSSYSAKKMSVSADDIGVTRQRELFDLVNSNSGNTPAVIDANTIRINPRASLSTLCDHIGLPFDADMLRWEKGPKPEDGVWAKHWYDAVWNSTGFTPPSDNHILEPMPQLAPNLQKIADQVWEDYAHLKAHCIC